MGGCFSSSHKKEKEKNVSSSSSNHSLAPSEDHVAGEHEPSEKVGYGAMVKQLYEALVCSIIRPPRAQYSIRDLGPPAFTFCGRQHCRRDFHLVNSRGLKVQCSHWEPAPSARPAVGMPCVVYLHGNSSSRAEGMDVLSYCLSVGITVLSLDFSGSGQSDGEYVSLGYYERMDLETVVQHLKENPGVSKIAAWGHSMGAVTAILHAAQHPNGDPLAIDGIIVDSAFMDLEGLALELVKDGKLLPMNVPGIVISGALRMIRGTVQKRAGFDIKHLSPIKGAPKCNTPAYICHGNNDEFIPPHHSKQLHEKYGGSAELVFFDGDHNSLRPDGFMKRAIQFLLQVLDVPQEFAVQSIPAYLPRLPWHQTSNKHTSNNYAQDDTSDVDLEAAIALSLIQNRGRGTNNTLQQQLEQQQQSIMASSKHETDLVAKLVELGFDEAEAREAATKHKSVEGAVGHLLEARS